MSGQLLRHGREFGCQVSDGSADIATPGRLPARALTMAMLLPHTRWSKKIESHGLRPALTSCLLLFCHPGGFFHELHHLPSLPDFHSIPQLAFGVLMRRIAS